MEEGCPISKRMGEYYSEHRPHLASYVYSIVKNREATQELVHEAYTRLNEELHRGHIREIRPWLWTVARNLSVDYLRSRGRTRSRSYCEHMHATVLTEEEDVFSGSEYEPYLQEGLQAMPKARANILLEHYIEGKTYKAMAEERGMSEESLKVAALRARRMLKSTLEKILEERSATARRTIESCRQARNRPE